MKKFLFLLLGSVLMITSVFAQEPELVINADDISYDKENHRVVAKGAVEIIYGDVTVFGNHMVYNTKDEEVHADNGFTIKYDEVSIEGKVLDYEVKKKTGVAEGFRFTYEGIELTGERINFSQDKYILKNSSFTTCDLEWPHYHISAGEIVLYPKYGWLVAYWGFFWLGRVPLVPVPTYIYDVWAEQRGGKNIPPFPEISSNDEDGVFINERLAWHIRRELSGTYSINYATKKGIGGGVDANYIVNETSRGNARFYGNATDGLWGGITHHLFFGNEMVGEHDLPFSFFAQPNLYEFDLQTTLSHRERINYQRVSYYPDILLRRNKGSVLSDNLKFDADLGVGVVAEDNNVNLSRGIAGVNVYWETPETNIGEIIPSIGLDSRFYSNGGKWVKSTGGIDYRKNFFDLFSLGLGYLHYFSVDGTSPFNFELYRFSAADRLKSDLFFVVGETGVGISTSYFLDNWDPEDIDYSLYFRLHCYNMIMQYRSLRNEFSLGFSLAGN